MWTPTLKWGVDQVESGYRRIISVGPPSEGESETIHFGLKRLRIFT